MMIVALIGELDLFEKERALGVMFDALSKSPNGVIVDLTNITLFTSAGVEALIRAWKQAKKEGTRLTVVVARNDYLFRKFEMLGFFEGVGIDFFETVEDAVKSYG